MDKHIESLGTTHNQLLDKKRMGKVANRNNFSCTGILNKINSLLLIRNWRPGRSLTIYLKFERLKKKKLPGIHYQGKYALKLIVKFRDAYINKN